MHLINILIEFYFYHFIAFFYLINPFSQKLIPSYRFGWERYFHQPPKMINQLHKMKLVII